MVPVAGASLDKARVRQAAGALLALDGAAEAARDAGEAAVSPQARAGHGTGSARPPPGPSPDAGRTGKPQEKRHAPAKRRPARARTGTGLPGCSRDGRPPGVPFPEAVNVAVRGAG